MELVFPELPGKWPFLAYLEFHFVGCSEQVTFIHKPTVIVTVKC